MEQKEYTQMTDQELLDEAKKIMIITGRGKHCENGKSIIKESIETYFTTINIRFENVENKAMIKKQKTCNKIWAQN